MSHPALPRPLAAITAIAPFTAGLTGQEALRRAVEAGALDGPAGETPAAVLDTAAWERITGLTEPAARRRLDRMSLLVAAAGRTALEEAGARAPAGGAVVLGTARGALADTAAFLLDLQRRGPRRVSPAAFPNLVMNAPAGHLAQQLGLHGPNLTVCEGEASGALAVALGATLIASGQTELAITGGADLVPPWPTRDAGGAHVAEGDGACLLVLESPSHAHQREARVLGWITGIGIGGSAVEAAGQAAPGRSSDLIFGSPEGVAGGGGARTAALVADAGLLEAGGTVRDVTRLAPGASFSALGALAVGAAALGRSGRAGGTLVLALASGGTVVALAVSGAATGADEPRR